MLGRHVYRVRPHERGGWRIEKEGDDKTRMRRASQRDAVSAADQLARADEPSRVVVENEEGAIVDERLHGSDDADVIEDQTKLGE